MKRRSERQGGKDDDPDDDLEESPTGPFNRADDAVLATRQIRGLPKRSLAGSPAATPPPTTNGTSIPSAPSTPTPRFGAFSGFGSPAINANAFSFTPPTTAPSFSTPTSSTPSQPPSSFSLGDAPTSPSPSSSFSNTPIVAPSASPATKTFASFIGSKPSESTQKSSQPTNISQNSQDPADAADTAAAKYYTSLRGLNLAFLSALSQAVDDDPFINVTDFLEQYQTLRLSVQKEFDAKSKPAAFTSTTMPAPPSTLSAFGSPSSLSTSSSAPALGGGFVPKVDNTKSTSSSGFSFSVPLPAASSTFTSAPLSKQSPFGSTSGDSTSTFGTSTFGSSSTPSSFGTTAKRTSSPTPFGFGASSSTSKSDPTTASTSVFGSSSTTSNLFGGRSNSNEDKPSASPFASSNSGSIFGSSGPSKDSTPASTITKPSAFGGFGGFGKQGAGSGSIGNPVGFGFGSPPKTPDPDAGAGSSGFTFGNSGTAGEKKSGDEGGEREDSTEGSGSGDGNGEAGELNPHANLLSTKNPHDEEGEGEEDEDTVHAIKLRAYKLKKKDEKDGGGSGWSEMGYGVLRLKKHKETDARRILLRNSSTGKININFNIYAGLKPSQSKKTLMFVGHDDGASQPYSVRLQNEDQARELMDVLEREIAFVKAKSES